MQVEPQIAFKGMDPIPHVEARIRERIARLEQFHGRMTSCRVVLQPKHQRGQKGHIYHVRLDIMVPGGEIVVNREPEMNHAHEDVLVAIRDAFNAAERRIEDHVRKLEPRLTKEHAEKLRGTVDRVFAQEGYGFIAADDGREFYFERDSVTGDGWRGLDVGSQVRFSEMIGEKGPFAVAVTVV